MTPSTHSEAATQETTEPVRYRKYRRIRSKFIEGLHMSDDCLYVLFQNGKQYRYRIGRDNLYAMLQAPSWPAYFAKHVRPFFPGDLIEGETPKVFGTILKRGQRR